MVQRGAGTSTWPPARTFSWPYAGTRSWPHARTFSWPRTQRDSSHGGLLPACRRHRAGDPSHGASDPRHLRWPPISRGPLFREETLSSRSWKLLLLACPPEARPRRRRSSRGRWWSRARRRPRLARLALSTLATLGTTCHIPPMWPWSILGGPAACGGGRRSPAPGALLAVRLWARDEIKIRQLLLYKIKGNPRPAAGSCDRTSPWRRCTATLATIERHPRRSAPCALSPPAIARSLGDQRGAHCGHGSVGSQRALCALDWSSTTPGGAVAHAAARTRPAARRRGRACLWRSPDAGAARHRGGQTGIEPAWPPTTPLAVGAPKAGRSSPHPCTIGPERHPAVVPELATRPAGTRPEGGASRDAVVWTG
jgi:hypothetical protein